jgi:hypothetical protein
VLLDVDAELGLDCYWVLQQQVLLQKRVELFHYWADRWQVIFQQQQLCAGLLDYSVASFCILFWSCRSIRIHISISDVETDYNSGRQSYSFSITNLLN